MKRGSAVERAWKAGSVVGSRLVCWEGAGAEDADQTAGQLGQHVPPPPLNGGKSALAMVRRRTSQEVVLSQCLGLIRTGPNNSIINTILHSICTKT